MGPVSVCRVGAVGADPVHVFGGEAHDFDLRHRGWLGWLPLTLVGFAGPGVALAGDTWLTAPSGRSEGPGHVVAGDLVTAQDAAGEFIARGKRGLTTYTNRPGDVLPHRPLWASSVPVLVASDLAANVDRLRSAQAAFAECVDPVDQEWAVLDACQSSPSGDSPVERCCGRAVSDQQEEQLRLHLLLEAAVRIGVFDPAVAVSRKPWRVGRLPRGRSMVTKMNAPTDAHQAKVLDERQLVENSRMRRSGGLSHRLCQLHRLFRVSVAPPSVPASGTLVPASIPIVKLIPMAVQSSCARSRFGLWPLKSARNASSGRPASVAARLGPQPSRFSCACTRSASRRLAGPVGFLFIRVFPLVLDVPVAGWAVARRSHGPSTIPCSCRARALGRRRRSGTAAGRAPLGRRFPVSLHGGFSRSRSRDSWRTCVLVRFSLPVGDFSSGDLRVSGMLSASTAKFSGPGVFSVRNRRPSPLDTRCSRMTEVAESIDFLRERIAGLDRQRARLVRAIEALQDTSTPSVPPSPLPLDGASAPEDPPKLAARILGVLRKSGPLNRRQLLRAFEDTDVKAGTLDSAVYRLKDRGLVDKRGDRFGIAESEAAAAGVGAEAGASSPSDGFSGPVGVAVEHGAPQVLRDRRVVPVIVHRAPVAAVPPDRVPDDDNAVPLTVRVHEAVVTGVASTRRALVRHFGEQGIPKSAVDTALSGLRKRRKLKSAGRGKIVVVGSGASPGPADAESQGS